MDSNNKLSRELAPGLLPAHKRNNVDAIVAFLLCEDGSVELTPEQKTLLDRADFADTQRRGRKLRNSAIVTLICNRWGVGSSTAWKDMERAGLIFGSTRLPNRDYLLALHIERIEDSIALHERQGKSNVLPKLYQALTNAINMLPDAERKQRSALVLNLNFGEGSIVMPGSPATEEDPEDIIRSRLEKKGVYIDYEDVEKEGADD